MSENKKIEGDIVDTSVEIPMSIESIVKRNCGFTKKWSDDEIAEMFRTDGKLVGSHPASILPRINLVKRTRELAVLYLLSSFEEYIPSGLRLPTKAECTKLAREIISEKNLRNKFNQTIIISVRLRPYNCAEYNFSGFPAVNLDIEFQDITYPF